MDKPKKSDRRRFLKNGALFGVAAGAMGLASAKALQVKADVDAPAPTVDPEKELRQLIAYGERSRYVGSIRVPVDGRTSPDVFGLTFHVLTPLQDSVGTITPSALHYIAAHHGQIFPDIDPKEHRLIIHGMVDRPLEFTMEDLKRLPFVTRLHYLECQGNHSRPEYTNVQQTHGMTSCSEWTGVPLSLLLKEAGVQKGGDWIVAEGAEEVKGASSIRMVKAMDDCLVCYGMNGEAIRPQQGFPLRLLVPGFEGIYQTKWLRRIKVVDRFYMTYNDYGHISSDARDVALTFQNGPKSVITYPSGGQQLAGPGFYEISGLAWSGCGAVRRVEVSTDGGQSWKDAEIRGTAYRMAHTRFGFSWKWNGQECELQSRCTDELDQVQPSRAQIAKFWKVAPDYYKTHGVPARDDSIQPWRIASDGSVHNAIG